MPCRDSLSEKSENLVVRLHLVSGCVLGADGDIASFCEISSEFETLYRNLLVGPRFEPVWTDERRVVGIRRVYTHIST